MGNVSMEARDINYRGGETKMSVEDALKSTSGEAAAIAALQEAVGNLQTTKANLITIAPVFSAEVAYDPGDLVYYNGLTYRCVNSHEGEWDADDFAATTISGELATLKSGLTNRFKTITSGSLHDITQSGIYYVTSGVADKPFSLGGLYVVSAYNSELSVGLYISFIDDNHKQASLVTHHDNTWVVADITSTTRA